MTFKYSFIVFLSLFHILATFPIYSQTHYSDFNSWNESLNFHSNAKDSWVLSGQSEQFVGLESGDVIEGIKLPDGLRMINDAFFEFDFGLLGGTSYYIFDKDEILDLVKNNQLLYTLKMDNSSFGIHFGIHTQFSAGIVFVRPDLVFNSNTFNYRVTDVLNSSVTYLAKERYQYLDIPVMIGVKLNPLKVMCGPVGHIFIANQSKLVEELKDLTTDFDRFTLGYQVGLGVDFFQIGFDLRYEGNLDKLGEGILFNGEKIFFSKNPSRLIATLTFAIK